MNRVTRPVVNTLVTVMLFALQVCHGAETLPPNSFDSGETDGWRAGLEVAQPVNQPSGGPNGDGDRFLLLAAKGGNGPGSRLSVFQDEPEWTGDFKTPGVTGLSVDMQNPTTSVPLEMRLVLFGPQSTNNRWTSAEPLSVSNDGAWRNYFFPINEAFLTRVQGNSSFDGTVSGVLRFMLRHDPAPPSRGGASVRAELGIDNIALVAGLAGDYNSNGQLDAGDLDRQAAGMMANDVAFDLNGDGNVDIDDRLKWIHDLQNSWAGDSNFDGEFSSSDFVAVFQVGKYESGLEARYAEGDWNGDTLFDSGDFVTAFQDGGFEQGPRVMMAAVPEPSTLTLLVLGLLRGLSLRRNRRSSFDTGSAGCCAHVETRHGALYASLRRRCKVRSKCVSRFISEFISK